MISGSGGLNRAQSVRSVGGSLSSRIAPIHVAFVQCKQFIALKEQASCMTCSPAPVGF